MNPIRIEQIKRVSAEIRAALGDDMDEQTFLDTLDGETDAMDLLAYMVKQRIEAQEIEKAMKAIAETYTERARRHADKVRAINSGLGKLLDAMGETKVTHQIGTVSRTKPRVSCVITAPFDVPSQLCKRVPDTAAIKKQLEAGDEVPGAELRAGEHGITVRVK
jgi:hypothetical protein